MRDYMVEPIDYTLWQRSKGPLLPILSNMAGVSLFMKSTLDFPTRMQLRQLVSRKPKSVSKVRFQCSNGCW